jgi:hypothetical protein
MTGGRDDPVFLTNDTHVLEGVRRVVMVANPGAGADWSVTVPGGHQWRLIGGAGVFTTSAVVANRFSALQVSDSDGVFYFNGSTSAQAASLAITTVYVPSTALFPASLFGPRNLVPFSPTWLRPGDILAASTFAIDVGDQWTSVRLRVEDCIYDNTALTDKRWNRHLPSRPELVEVRGDIART